MFLSEAFWLHMVFLLGCAVSSANGALARQQASAHQIAWRHQRL